MAGVERGRKVGERQEYKISVLEIALLISLLQKFLKLLIVNVSKSCTKRKKELYAHEKKKYAGVSSTSKRKISLFIFFLFMALKGFRETSNIWQSKVNTLTRTLLESLYFFKSFVCLMLSL